MHNPHAYGSSMLTVGQYLQPGRGRLRVERFVEPAHFEEFRWIGVEIGFANVASGPLVRSSYHADRQAAEVACPLPRRRTTWSTTSAAPLEADCRPCLRRCVTKVRIHSGDVRRGTSLRRNSVGHQDPRRFRAAFRPTISHHASPRTNATLHLRFAEVVTFGGTRVYARGHERGEVSLVPGGHRTR